MKAAKKKIVRSRRLDLRVTPDQKSLIERAAALTGNSITSFVVNSAQEVATRTIKEHEIMILARRDAEIFVKALLNPPKPSARLLRAAKRYKTLTGQ